MSNSESNQDSYKELDLIQSVINRMANNSFLIKGWAMTLMSALIAFGKDSILGNMNNSYYLIMIIGVLIPFWILDAYYLRQERIFIRIYNQAIADPKALSRTRFDLKPTSTAADRMIATMFSKSLFWFYVPFIVLISIAVIFKLTGIF